MRLKFLLALVFCFCCVRVQAQKLSALPLTGSVTTTNLLPVLTGSATTYSLISVPRLRGMGEHAFGTVANGGTATISINTNHYTLTASGAGFDINLPTLPDSTNRYACQLLGTNTSGGTQIVTFKVATVTTTLSRPEAGRLDTSTFTNDASAIFLVTVVGSAGAWKAFSVQGDQLSIPALTAADIDTAAELLAITPDLFDLPAIGSFALSQHAHIDAPSGGLLSENSISFTDITTGNASTNAHGFMRKLSGDPAKVINGQGNEVDLPGGGGAITAVRGASFVGGGVVLSTNMLQPIWIPFSGFITEVTALGDTIGSAVIDIFSTNYGGYSALGSSITASATPTITSTNKYHDSTLTGWTTNVVAGTILTARLTSVSSFTNLSLSLSIRTSGGLLQVKFVGVGTVPDTNQIASVYVAEACTIRKATILSDTTGSGVIDIWVTPYASYPPTVANSITGSSKPTLTTGIKSQDSTLSGWTPQIAAGSTVSFHLDSVSTLGWISLFLDTTK